MPNLENASKQLLIVATNSGPAVYLAPGEAAELPAFEIEGNAKVAKLVKAGALAIKGESQAASEASEPASEKSEAPSKPKSKGTLSGQN